jgi:phage terminase large subunit
MHWAYKYFKENPDPNTICVEWATAENPHFPKEELESLKSSLDPETYRQMFDLIWDTIPKHAVYSDFTEDNILDNYVYHPNWETYVSVDWGYAHQMAIGFFQYDRENDTVYLFDEIIEAKMVLETAYDKIMAKHYQITDWDCDIAGNQERELTGMSNIKWFKKKGVHFKYKSDSIQNGIALVRSYIKTVKGQRKFYVSKNCKKSIDGIKQYRYPEKDGNILNENPIKKDDDACDMVRYFFINFLRRDLSIAKSRVSTIR